jgi:uridylate kinase
MDMTAFTLCRENNLPIIVFNINEEDAFLQVVMGEPVGTIVE